MAQENYAAVTAAVPVPEHEQERLQELDRYRILFTEPEVSFDRITALAARLFQAPIALISFVAGDFQWFKSCIGFGASQTSREVSICTWAILEKNVLVVPDAQEDPRFACNPLVTAEDGIRFYAGAPLITPKGHILGTICVIDTKPRPQGITEDEEKTLEDLAAMTMSELDLHLTARIANEAQAFSRSVLESSPDCVKVLDLNGNLLSINERGCQQMEIDDFSTCFASPWLQFWEGEHRQDAEKALKLAQGGQIGKFQGYCSTAKGQGKWWEVIVTPIRNAEGKPAQILSVSRDITERKEAEAKLKASHQELENTAAELRRSNEDLEEFAYVASHDLKSPLKTVIQFTQLLARRCGNTLDENAKDYLQLVTDSALRMARLIDDLLQYSKATAAVSNIHPPQLVNSEAVLQAALVNLSSTLQESGATVSFDPLPRVYLDGSRLLQLFQNLIGNAIHYRREETPRIHVAVRRDGRQCIFSIQDNGAGIAPEYREFIFQPFKRLHGLERSGSGLGLAVCRKIVERAGGRIWVESQPGVGSTFYFSLPG
jgi:PAS domain S-box-containing protein